MDQRTKKKFQVIGACAKTQTLSLDEEIRLIEGVPYNLDFFQDFSVRQLNGRMLQDISLLDLRRMLDKIENGIVVIQAVSQAFAELSDRERMLVRGAMEEECSMVQWEVKHDKKSGKKAIRKWEKLMRDWGINYD